MTLLKLEREGQGFYVHKLICRVVSLVNYGLDPKAYFICQRGKVGLESAHYFMVHCVQLDFGTL